MQNILTLAICILICMGNVHAQQDLSTQQKAVNETVIAMFDALANRDTVNMKLYCTKDLLLLEDKELWTLDTLTLKVSQNKDSSYTRKNKFDFIETKIEGRMAWTSYYNQANISRRGRQIMIRWLETAILVKENKKWKIRVLHSTTVERK